MEESKISILEQYHIRVTRVIMICGILGVSIGFTALTIFKLLGNMENIPMKAVVLIDLFIVIPELYIFTKIYISVVSNGRINRKIFNRAKVETSIILFINYYIFTLVEKSREFWYLSFFFALLVGLFLDMKLSVIVNILLTISMFIVGVIEPLERPHIELFTQDLFIRCMLSIIIMSLITITTYCSAKILLNLKAEKEKELINYLEKLEQNQNQIREIKHNLNNQIIVLQSLLEQNNIKEARLYINKIIEITERKNYGQYTENLIINSIINFKINESKDLKINWNIEIQVPKRLNIDNSDLGIIIGNLLDNAIDACAFLEDIERKVYVKIFSNKNNIVICIENTKNNIKIYENTWKQDKDNHGIGLKSVGRLVAKYNGAMECSDNGNFFEVNIILWN